MAATVRCIYAIGRIQLLVNNSSKSTNAFLAVQWAMERGYEMELMRNGDGKIFRRRGAE